MRTSGSRQGGSDRKHFEALFHFILCCFLVWNFSLDIFHGRLVETISILPGNSLPRWEEALVPERIDADGDELWKLLKPDREPRRNLPICTFSIQNRTSSSIHPLDGSFYEREAISLFL